jgi:DNA-binding LytR/AlgR family response regulator
METTIHIGGRKHVEPGAVIFLIADQNYTKLIMENGEKIMVATTLKKLQARLQAAGDFFRPNRGDLINLNYMATYTETSITLANNQTFKITRRRQSAFLNKIGSGLN